MLFIGFRFLLFHVFHMQFFKALGAVESVIVAVAVEVFEAVIGAGMEPVPEFLD